MPYRFRPPAELLAEACEVEVRVGKCCISLYRSVIGGQSIIPVP